MPTYYGVPWGFDTLANLTTGTEGGVARIQSIRFLAAYTGTITSLRLYLITTSGGYYAGNGGYLNIQFKADDGTANHQPTGTSLGGMLVDFTPPHGTSPVIPDSRDLYSGIKLYTLTTPVSVVAGNRYHIVFTNTYSDPTNNYVSIDYMHSYQDYITGVTVRCQPGVPLTDLAQLWNSNYPSQAPIGTTLYGRPGYTPLYGIYGTLTAGGSFSQGQGYTSSGANWGKTLITGTVKARSVIVPSSTVVVTSVSVFVARSNAGSSGPLTVELQNSSGIVLETGTIAWDASIPAATPNLSGSWTAPWGSTSWDEYPCGWGTITFPSPRTLTAGTTYYLQLSSPDTGVTWINHPYQAGDYSYSFPAYNIDNDSHWEKQTTTGGAWAASSNGTHGKMPAYFVVTTAPVTSFTGTPTSGGTPLAVQFTDTSTGVPTSWAWTFGDGGTSTAQSPSHTYTVAGTYTVTLIATNANGSNTSTRTSYIVASSPSPVANFNGTPLTGTIPLAVQFNDTSTNTPTSWAWVFGDGTTSTAQSPSHTYTTAGTYTVALTATNASGSNTNTKAAYVTAAGAVTDRNPSHTYTTAGTYTVALTSTNAAGSNTKTRVGYIEVTTPLVPVVAFSATPLSGVSPLVVAFTDLSTNRPTSWAWAFGDGAVSAVKNPNHTYATAGSYTVTLTATNAAGSGTPLVKTAYVVVSTPPPPGADFLATPITGGVPTTVVFTDRSTNIPVSWSWSFGDASTSTLQNPSHTYAAAGTYTVSLTATNAGGSDTMTRTGYIVIAAVAPTADFTGAPVSGDAPLTVQFTNTTTGSAVSQSWSFGDGT